MSKKIVSIQDLLQSGVHFGHRTNRWHPKMKPYIFTERNGIHIIDLQQTVKAINEVSGIISKTVADGGEILFVGTKRQAQQTVADEAERCGMPYVNERWLGGTLTNWPTISKRIEELERLEKMQESGEVELLTKKEGLMIQRQIDRLHHRLSGLLTMKGVPQLLFVIDIGREQAAIHEASLLNIPVIAMADTNYDPRDINYVIPSNDDAIRAIKLIMSTMANAVLEGKSAHAEDEEEAKVAAKSISDKGAASVKADIPALSDAELLGEATLEKMEAERKALDALIGETESVEEEAVEETEIESVEEAVSEEEGSIRKSYITHYHYYEDEWAPPVNSHSRGDKFPEKEIEQTQYKKIVKRVLNANFSHTHDKDHTLGLRESLGADDDYNLYIDIGLPWTDEISLFLAAFFPEKAVGDILSEDDKKRGSFDVEVIFASEDFSPRIVTGMINLPVGSIERSIPYIDGKLAEKPGWLSLRVRTPSVSEPNLIVNAHGRLSLYYKNNLLQSGIIRVGVTQKAGLSLDTRNSGEIDFVLSGDFVNVEEKLSTRRLKLGQEGTLSNYPVATNITLNSIGKGDGHHMLIKYYDEKTASDLQPAFIRYNPTSTDSLLELFRKALFQRTATLNDKYGKKKADFIEDLTQMAYLGSELRKNFSGRIQSNINPVVWRKSLQQVLDETAIIQVARTGSANYAFPWALIYDYEMDDPFEPDDPEEPDGKKKTVYKKCKSLSEWNQDGIRTGRIEKKCPYEDDPEHGYENVLCPYAFWGLKHVIEQPISDHVDNTSNAASKETLVGENIKLSVGVTDRIDHDLRDKHLKSIVENNKIKLDPEVPARERTEIFSLLREPEVVYFLCHGEFQSLTADKEKGMFRPNKPYLSFGKGDRPENRIDPAFWEHRLFKYHQSYWEKHKPIVFINGCHTVDVSPSVVLNFLSSFKNLGANAVIGTEVSVLAGMATYIGDIILKKIADEETMGDAIREMRWELANRGNLLGLAYTPYGFADLKIVRKNQY